jgi:hypothetical protein
MLRRRHMICGEAAHLRRGWENGFVLPLLKLKSHPPPLFDPTPCLLLHMNWTEYNAANYLYLS